MPTKFIDGRRPVPVSHSRSGVLVYEILVPIDEFKHRLWVQWKTRGMKTRYWEEHGPEVRWESHEKGFSVLYLTRRAPEFVGKPNPHALGFVWFQQPANVYPVGFWGGVAWVLTDKP